MVCFGLTKWGTFVDRLSNAYKMDIEQPLPAVMKLSDLDNNLPSFKSLYVLVHWCSMGNYDINAKQKISFIYKTKLGKILLKPKVKDQENFCQILWTFIQVLNEICSTFVQFSWHEQKFMKLSLYLTNFPSQFSNIYQKYFRLFQN